MKILYITRHFNRSGYYILDKLSKEKFEIAGIVLKKTGKPFGNTFIRKITDLFYKIKCLYYRCYSDRFCFSEMALAVRNKLNTIYTDDINSDRFYNILLKLSPDIIVLGGGWHQLLSKRVFNFPPFGTINTHPSLLPLYRGTSVHRWQIKDGVKKSGVTIHYVRETFDTGDIIAQKEVDIELNDTPQSLFDKTAKESANVMVDVLKKITVLEKGGKLPVVHQINAPEHYCHKWIWDDDSLRINWNKRFIETYNFIRACHQESYQYKGPIFMIKGIKYFLRKALLKKKDTSYESEKKGIIILKTDKDGIYLVRRNDPDILVISQVQKYDKYYRFRRALNAVELVRNNMLSVGQIFAA